MRQIIAVLLACGLLSAQVVVVPVHKRPVATGGGGGISITWSASESHSNQNGAAANITTPGTIVIAAGDIVVVTVATYYTGAAEAVSAVTCGANTLTQAARWYSSTDSYQYLLYYKLNASAATTTCTATFGSTTYRAIAATSWHVSGGTASFDKVSCNDATCVALVSPATTNRTAQNVTTTVQTELLVGTWIDWDYVNTSTGQNGYAIVVEGDSPQIASKVVTSTGTYPAGNFATVNQNDKYASIFVTFGVQ